MALSSSDFTKELVKNDLGPVIEVPCSYLKHWLNYLWDTKQLEIINPANEAIAMAIAAGYYLGTGKISVVAMQNSGLMNTLNAVTSLHGIYNIPAFMIVTWRGGQGVGTDAPEHDITGEHMEKILQTFDLPYEILDCKHYKRQIQQIKQTTQKSNKPAVLVIRKGIFEPFTVRSTNSKKQVSAMNRYEAIAVIKKHFQDDKNALFLSGTGFPSRDSFNVQDTPDFYTMGSMGHVLGIAIGVSRTQPKKKIVVLDGDGGALMQAGTFASIDKKLNKNLIYCVLDNDMYESTGGQACVSNSVHFQDIASAVNMEYFSAKNENQLQKTLKKIEQLSKPTLLHIQIASGDHPGKRVSDDYTCEQITKRFMKNIVHEV